jgi:hypothetical protein
MEVPTMSESKKNLTNRADELREAAREFTTAPDANPEMLPGESPLHYTERRRRQREQMKKHSKPAAGEEPT